MAFVEVVRGDVLESRHRVSVVVADAHGDVVAWAGEAGDRTFYRSAAKPLQALPLVEEAVAERMGLTDRELALCCASHEGTPEHVAGVRSILAKAGVDEGLLRCGPQAPFSQRAARALYAGGTEPERVHNNCSGKHAGMLALAVGLGWDPVDYHLPDHPVQRRMLSEVVRWAGLLEDDVAVAVDGCGVPCFAVPLDRMAVSFARFTAAAATQEPVERVVRAMTGHPFMVGGEGRTCTDVMARTGGRAWVKLGAEGVYGGGVPAHGLGFAIKVEDGGRRAVEAAVVRVLEELGVLSAGDVDALARHARPPIRNTRGEVVGTIRAAFRLEQRAPSARAST